MGKARGITKKHSRYNDSLAGSWVFTHGQTESRVRSLKEGVNRITGLKIMYKDLNAKNAAKQYEVFGKICVLEEDLRRFWNWKN